LVLAVQLGVAIIVGAVGIFRPGQPFPSPLLLAVPNVIAFGSVLIVGTYWSGQRLQDLYPFRRVATVLLFPMLCLTIGLSIALSEVDNRIQQVFPAPTWLQQTFSQLLSNREVFLPALALLVVVAPLTEELFFRGLLFYGLVRNYGPWFGVFGTAVLFGVVHLNPWQFIGAFVLGLAFGWWTLKTGSLLPAILGHALNNGLGPFSLHVLGWQVPGYNMWTPGVPTHQPWWFTLTGVLLCGLSAWWLHRYWSGRN